MQEDAKLKQPPKSIEFALHNFGAAEHIKKDPRLCDWQITTSFYSAIHFINHKIFEKPLTESANGKTVIVKSFDSYYAMHKNENNKSKSKHQVRVELVKKKLPPEVSASFQWLHDTCHTARYVDYRMKDGSARLAESNLQCIMQHCQPKPK